MSTGAFAFGRLETCRGCQEEVITWATSKTHNAFMYVEHNRTCSASGPRFGVSLFGHFPAFSGYFRMVFPFTSDGGLETGVLYIDTRTTVSTYPSTDPTIRRGEPAVEVNHPLSRRRRSSGPTSALRLGERKSGGSFGPREVFRALFCGDPPLRLETKARGAGACLHRT